MGWYAARAPGCCTLPVVPVLSDVAAGFRSAAVLPWPDTVAIAEAIHINWRYYDPEVLFASLQPAYR